MGYLSFTNVFVNQQAKHNCDCRSTDRLVYDRVLPYIMSFNPPERPRDIDKELERIYNPKTMHILTPFSLKHLAREWLKEDVPSFDFAGFVVGEKQETAVLLLKQEGVIAGRPFVDAVFKELDCSIEWHVEEGDYMQPITKIATVTGKVRHLLLGERVALNCLTRCSGIATMARNLSKLAVSTGWKGQIAGTRKTTPGFRLVEKYALLVGGASAHRHDLSSMIMLKDNHIWTAGSITQVDILNFYSKII